MPARRRKKKGRIRKLLKHPHAKTVGIVALGAGAGAALAFGPAGIPVSIAAGGAAGHLAATPLRKEHAERMSNTRKNVRTFTTGAGAVFGFLLGPALSLIALASLGGGRVAVRKWKSMGPEQRADFLALVRKKYGAAKGEIKKLKGRKERKKLPPPK